MTPIRPILRLLLTFCILLTGGAKLLLSPLSAAPADKTLNLSVYDAGSSPGKFATQQFTTAGNTGKFLGWNGSAWGLYDAPILGTAGSTANRLLRASGTGGATIQSSAVTVADDGTMTIGTTALPVVASNAGVVMSRTITGTSADAHGFREASTFLEPGFGYAAYDAVPTIGAAAAGAYNHVSVFQVRPQIHCATIDNVYGVYSYPPIYTGSTVANLNHIHIAGMDAQGGSVTIQRGVYIGDLSGTYQVALESTGSDDKSCFAGTLVVGADNITTLPAGSDKFHVAGSSTTTGNSITTGKIASTASTPASLGAGTVALAITSNVATVTGNGGGTTIGTITGGVSGQVLTLIFTDSNVSITDTSAATANTVNIGSAFTSTADDTITLVFDGNKWFETARSVN